MLYEILRSGVELPPLGIYGVYEDRVSSPKAPKPVRRYLNKMGVYGLLESDGTTRDRAYRVGTSGYVEPALGM